MIHLACYKRRIGVWQYGLHGCYQHNFLPIQRIMGSILTQLQRTLTLSSDQHKNSYAKTNLLKDSIPFSTW